MRETFTIGFDSKFAGCSFGLALPKRKLEIVHPQVIGIARSIPIRLDMNAETVGPCRGSWVERFVDRVCDAVQGERLKHSFSVVDFRLDYQVLPCVCRGPLARNARRHP